MRQYNKIIQKKIIQKKSQAALEFIMTYGWAILAVLVAVGALAYLGVGSKTNTALPRKCIFSNGISCLGDQINKTASIIAVQNNLGQPIYNVMANFTDRSLACSVVPSPCADGCIMNISCNTNGQFNSSSAHLKLALYYQKIQGGYYEISTGDVFDRVG